MPFSDAQLVELKEFNELDRCLITLERTYNPVRVKYATHYQYKKDDQGNEIIAQDAEGKDIITQTAITKETYDKSALWTWLQPELRPGHQPAQHDGAFVTPLALSYDHYIFAKTCPGTRGEVVEIIDVQPQIVKTFVEIFSKDASTELSQSDLQFIVDWVKEGGCMDGYIDGFSLLYLAALHNKIDLVAVLLTLPNIDINSTSINKAEAGMTPFFAAASSGSTEICQSLHDKGAEVNQKQEAGPGMGYYPLFIAVQNGHFTTAELLLHWQANPNEFQEAEEVKGWTPLLIAISNQREDLVELLLKNKADPNLACKAGKNRGMTPLLLAVSKGNEDIIKLLRQYGAKVEPEVEGKPKNPITYARKKWGASVVAALTQELPITFRRP